MRADGWLNGQKTLHIAMHADNEFALQAILLFSVTPASESTIESCTSQQPVPAPFQAH